MSGKRRNSYRKELVAIVGESGLDYPEIANLLSISFETIRKWRQMSYSYGVPLWAVRILPFMIAKHYIGLGAVPPDAITKRINSFLNDTLGISYNPKRLPPGRPGR